MATQSHTPTLDEFEWRGILWNNYTTPEVLRRAVCEFPFRPTDICVCTFPRCGTTLTQEIVWQLVHRQVIQPGAKFAPLDDRFPFLEYNYGWDASGPVRWGIDELEAAPEDRQRLIKTHCPYSLIGSSLDRASPRIIAVLRNPKDCCNSLYHFYKGLDMYGPWPGDWDEFVDMFLRGRTMCGDYFQVASEWWQQRSRPNVLLLKYEDIVRSPKESIGRIADHLAIRPNAEQLACVMYNCSFEAMSGNDNVNITFAATGFSFLRKGLIGDWRAQFTAEQSRRFDEAAQERLAPIGLEFQYD